MNDIPLQATSVSAVSPNGLTPEKSKNVGGGSSRILAFLVVLVILITSGMPYVARSIAMASITPSSMNPSTEEPSSDGTENSSLTTDLGIRTLPLLSDQAKQAWYEDPDKALHDAGVTVFGDQWERYLSVADDIALNAQPTMEAGVPTDFDGGELGNMATHALLNLSASEQQRALDLAGLMQLHSARLNPIQNPQEQHYSSIGFAALALVFQADLSFGTCNSSLTKAYSVSLATAYSALDIEPSSSEYFKYLNVSSLFGIADSKCDSDPTPAVELLRWRLSGSSGMTHKLFGGGVFANITVRGGWNALIQELDSLETAYGEVPGAQLILGDAYSWIAHTGLQKVGIGPFTQKESRTRAISHYEALLQKVNMPNAAASLARAYLDEGRLADAEALLNRIPDNDATTYSLQTQAVIAARQQQYDKVTQLLQQLNQLPTTAKKPVVSHDIYRYLPTPLEEVFYSYIPVTEMLLYGGSSWTEGFGFTPESRYFGSRPGDVGERIELAFLADHRPSLETLCDLAWGTGASRLCYLSIPEGWELPNEDFDTDIVQDLHRKYGDFDGARDLLITATSTRPHASQSWERLGEVYFLQSEWSLSAQASSKVTNGWLDTENWDLIATIDRINTGPGWALLRKGAALRQIGDYPQASKDLEEAFRAQYLYDPEGAGDLEISSALGPHDGWGSLLRMYISQEVSQLALTEGDYQRGYDYALDSIETRYEYENPSGEYGPIPRKDAASVHGVQEQIASICASHLGLHDEAIGWAEKALAADPYSPLYAETLAEAKRASVGTSATPNPNEEETQGQSQATDKQELITLYQESLDRDPTLFSSWNNMGVLLALDGRSDEAIASFKHAIEVRADYACAWFNLGVAWRDKGDFFNFLRSQGALGNAGLLDSTLKTQTPVFHFDEEVYQSGLDVSKTIPADWHLTKTVRSNPNMLTFGLIAIIVLSTIGQVVRSEAFSSITRSSLHRFQRSKHAGILARIAGWRPHWVITSAVTFGAMLYLSGASGIWEICVSAVVCLALLSAHLLAPNILATFQSNVQTESSSAVKHISFVPASIITVLGAPFGLGFTPPAPLAETDVATRIKRAGLITLIAAGVLFVAAAWITGVPFAHAAVVMAVLVVVSALLPVSPLDGSRLEFPQWIQWGLTALTIALTALIALSII